MSRALYSIISVRRLGRIFASAAFGFLSVGGLCLPCLGADIQKGTPETPSGMGAVAGKYICHDGNVYRVVLTLNSNGTYRANGSSCVKNKGDASGTGTWNLSERIIILVPSKEDGWMNKEPKVFNVLKFKGDWILVRVDWPEYYNQRGVTDVSCFQRQEPEESCTPISDEELPLLTPFKAVVEQKQPCAACLKATDGKRLRIGGPGATPEVLAFVQELEEGQTYKFPNAFLEHRKGGTEKP